MYLFVLPFPFCFIRSLNLLLRLSSLSYSYLYLIMFTDFARDADDDGNDDYLNKTCNYFDSQEFNSIHFSSPGNFSIYYMNSRSLCRHFFDIQDFLATLDHSFSLYGFTETWFKEAPPSFVHISRHY